MIENRNWNLKIFFFWNFIRVSKYKYYQVESPTKKQATDYQQSQNRVMNFLEFVYSNPATHSNSIEGLYQNALSNNLFHLVFNREDVRRFLSSKLSFNIFQPIDKSQFQQKVPLVVGRLVKWQMDLVDMQKYSSENDDVRYLLTIIDVFSKYAHVIPLKDKTSRQVSTALFTLFSTLNISRPRLLQSDQGKEFIGSETRKICEALGIVQIFSYAYSPLGYIERFNKTLKQKIFSWLQSNREHNYFWTMQGQVQLPFRYIDNLQHIVHNYNHSIHSSLKEAPFTVHFCDANDRRCMKIQNRIYNRSVRKNNNNPIIRQPFLPHDKVVILSYLNPVLSNLEKDKIKKKFNKVSTPKWTNEFFEILEVSRDELNQNILRYTLQDKFDHPIKRKFYHHEIQKIS